MISKDVYEKLENRFKDVASWAIWSPAENGENPAGKHNTGNMDVFKDDNLLDKLHANFVLVALNAGEHDVRKDGYTGSWRMFHSDDTQKQQDYKLRYAFQDTPIWGSYMTDLIKNHPDKNSVKVLEHIKEYPQVLQDNIEVLKEELNIIGGKPVLIALGRSVESILKKELGNQYEVVYLTHYSHMISADTLKENVNTLLKNLEK